jgi:crossover junction endodeoxyribonuclease RuvC
MIILGIDPGLSGALAFFHVEKGHLSIVDMPTVEVIRNNKKKNEINAGALAHIIKVAQAEDTIHATLERVGAMPGQGVTSMFSMGRSVGIIEGVLATLEIPVTITAPKSWQKMANVRDGKDGSRLRATELFPAYAGLFARKKDNGRSDAALIAWAGLQMAKSNP